MNSLTRLYSRRRRGVPSHGLSAAQDVLGATLDEALASYEIIEALRRSHISADDARAAVARGADEIVGEVSTEYRAYVAATARRLETIVKADMLTAGMALFLLGYATLSLPKLTATHGTVLILLAVFPLFRLKRLRIPRVQRADEAARIAGQRWRDAMRDDALLPFLRGWITEEAADDLFGTRLDPQIAPGLIERSAPKHLVTTASTREILKITSTLSGGSLGLSGPRGSGKTTLISSFCAGGYERPDSPPELSVMVSAPVDYEGRAFILHLFVQLCRAVQVSRPVRDERSFLPRPFKPTRAPQTLFGAFLMIVGAIACWEAWNPPPKGKPAWQATLLFGTTGFAVLAIVGGLALIGLFGRDPAWPFAADSQTGSMAERTRSQLRRLKFVQTMSTVSNATIKISVPFATDLGRSFTNQLAEQQLTLPELVEEYQRYATDVAYWWREQNGGQGRLFIGIDEVDRIVDPGKAQRFLNEAKAVFNVPYCFYLVSVSEEALAAFERRSMVARSAFDTAFDEVVRVDYLTYDAAIELLSKRVAGLPRPFIALCQCLAGGLPRDLVRFARALVEAARETQERELGALVRVLVAKEFHKIKHSHLTTLGALSPQILHPVTVLLHEKKWPDISPEGLRRAAIDDLAPDHNSSADDALALLTLELKLACRFHATLLEVFEHSAFSDRLRNPLSPEAGIIDQLAEIRGFMTTNQPLALQLITRLRADEGFSQIV